MFLEAPDLPLESTSAFVRIDLDPARLGLGLHPRRPQPSSALASAFVCIRPRPRSPRPRPSSASASASSALALAPSSTMPVSLSSLFWTIQERSRPQSRSSRLHRGPRPSLCPCSAPLRATPVLASASLRTSLRFGILGSRHLLSYLGGPRILARVGVGLACVGLGPSALALAFCLGPPASASTFRLGLDIPLVRRRHRGNTYYQHTIS